MQYSRNIILLAIIIFVRVDAVPVNFTEAHCSGLMNTAVIVGSRATFECYYHNLANQSRWHLEWYLLWYDYKSMIEWLPVSSGNRVRSFLKDRYQVKIDVENKRTSLSINAVQLEDAGLYASLEYYHISPFYTVDLIVLAPIDTMCHVSQSIWNNGHYQVEEFKQFEVHCSVNYTGNWSPTIHCELPFEHEIVSSSSNVSKSVSLTQRITAFRNMSNTTFICKTSFNKDGLHFLNLSHYDFFREHANNVPDFIFNWTSPVIRVVYGPELVTITTPSGNETVNPGSVLKCTSNGNPPPHYEWIDLTTNRFEKGPHWTVSDDWSNNNNQTVLILQCTAKIEALGKIYSSTVKKTLTVIKKKRSEVSHDNWSPLNEVTSDGTIFLIIISVIVVLASVTVNAVLLLKLHHSRQSRRVTEMPVAADAATDAVGVYQEVIREDVDRSGLSSVYEMLPTRSLYEDIDLPPERRDQVPEYINLPKDRVAP